MNIFGRKEPKKPVPQTAPEPPKFSLQYLRNMHRQLVENKIATEANQSQVIEILRVIAEMVVYGDSKSELLFDFFCEANMLSLFLDIMRCQSGCPVQIHIQILQTLSILCQSVRNTTSMYYLLSNNYVNEIIVFPYNFEDEELCDNFISFMKSLSLRLNQQTVQFFFIEETGAYPLLSRAIFFLHFKEPMVRTAAQAIILNVYRITEIRAREYALQDNIIEDLLSAVSAVFNSMYSTMRDAYLAYRQVEDISGDNVFTPQQSALINQHERQLESTVTGFEDWLYYLQDVVDLKVPRLTKVLITRLMSDFVYSTLLEPLSRLDTLPDSANYGVVNFSEVSLSLFIICQMLRVITNTELHRALTVGIFHPLNKISRKFRTRDVIKHHHGTKDSLALKLLHNGRTNARTVSESSLVFLESNHPQLVKKKEQQIAELTSRLRSMSGAAERSSISESVTSDGRELLGNLIGNIPQTIVESSVNERNSFRCGFERLFGDTNPEILGKQNEDSSLDTFRCSLLACLTLQKLCTSVLSLAERSRYGPDDSHAGDDEQVAASAGTMHAASPSERAPAAAYVYSHLFQSLMLWPSLSDTESIFPPIGQYWNNYVEPCAVDVKVQEQRMDSIERKVSLDLSNVVDGAPSIEDLEFDQSGQDSRTLNLAISEPIDEGKHVRKDDDDIIKGIKLDMTGDSMANEASSIRNVHIPSPLDFDVSMELCYAAADVLSNPFSTEPGLSITARRKSLNFTDNIVEDQRVNNSEVPHDSPLAGLSSEELLKMLKGSDWIDSDIIPIPVLDSMYTQRCENKSLWLIETPTIGILQVLMNLVASKRAHNSLPIMQLCLSCMYQNALLMQNTLNIFKDTPRSLNNLYDRGNLRFVLETCSVQVQLKAQKLIGYANGDMSEEFLNLFENEIQRAFIMGTSDTSGTTKITTSKQSWFNNVEKLSRDVSLLMLKNSRADFESYSQVIASSDEKYDRSVIISRIEALEIIRRDIQIFLLLRSAVKRLQKLLQQPEAICVLDAVALKKQSDQLFTLMIDEYVGILGQSMHSGNPPLVEGSAVVMKGRQCVAAFVIPSRATNASSSSSPVGAVNSSSKSPVGSNSNLSAGAQSSPMPRILERNRKPGDAYYILDDMSILIASPDKSKMDRGVVRICCPVYNAIATIDTVDPRDLRILVQSSTAISGMTEVSCSTYPDVQNSSSPFNEIRSNAATSPFSGSQLSPNSGTHVLNNRRQSVVQNSAKSYNIFGPPIVATSMWEVSIGFESAKNCEIVAQHIAMSRIRVRATRLDNIRSFLTYWSDSESFVVSNSDGGVDL